MPTSSTTHPKSPSSPSVFFLPPSPQTGASFTPTHLRDYHPFLSARKEWMAGWMHGCICLLIYMPIYLSAYLLAPNEVNRCLGDLSTDLSFYPSKNGWVHIPKMHGSVFYLFVLCESVCLPTSRITHLSAPNVWMDRCMAACLKRPKVKKL